MRHSSKQILGFTWVCAVVLTGAACTQHRIPPATVEDLMEDRVMLDGLLIKCNQNPASVRNPSECESARIASERLAAQQVDTDVERKRAEEFEKAREQLRLAQEKKRAEQEAKTKVDPYTMPVVPVDPPPGQASAPAPPGSPPPTAGTNLP
jgi:hypothetical protein